MLLGNTHRGHRIREMSASGQKCCRLALLLTLLPIVMTVDVELPSLNPAAVQAAQQHSAEGGKTRYIITARALDGDSEYETEGPEEDETTDYAQTEEVEDEMRSTTESGLFTSTSASTYSTEPSSTTANHAEVTREDAIAKDDNDLSAASTNHAEEVHEDDLSGSATNLDIHQQRRSEPETGEHKVLYARLKQPLLRPTISTEQTETSVGSLFGHPYNAPRPFGPRFPGFLGGATPDPVIFVRPTPAADRGPVIPIHNRPLEDDLSTSTELAGYGSSRPNRYWEIKEKAANQRINMTRVQSIEAECQNDFMKIRLRFNGSFSGIIYSTGFAYDPLCVYVNGTGRDYYEFYIQLNRCGTLGANTHNLDSRKQPTKNVMWNTLSIQYSALIEEEWDEHYKMTCEYGYDYWKTVTFPFLDVEVATGNPLTFTLTPPECHMEIRSGYGTTGTRITGPVRVGDPLTLIVYMRSQFDGFDVIVSDCYAHNGANKKIQLIDTNGCPINEKLISRFRGTWTDSGLYETQVFAYMKAFRFTGSPALYIECDVRMCHGHCPIQPCYWRNSRDITKRDVIPQANATSFDGTESDADSNAPVHDIVKRDAAKTTPVATALSENLSLFQSLQVIADDEASFGEGTSAGSTRDVDPDQICLKPVAVGTIFGLAGLVTVCLGIMSCILCLRLRRRTISENTLYHQSTYAPSTIDYSKHSSFH